MLVTTDQRPISYSLTGNGLYHTHKPRAIIGSAIVKSVYYYQNYPSEKAKFTNIASELWRLKKHGRIVVIEKGISRNPNYYAIADGEKKEDPQ